MPGDAMLLILSGPSGAGKSTLCDRLLAEFPTLRLSVSTTTRAPRGAEQHGVHYFFVTPERFSEMVSEEAFAEHATVHGNRYGTSKAVIEESLRAGNSVLFDIDFQGAESLLAYRSDAIAVMVFPPSMEVLEQRLRGRGTDSAEVVARRLQAARAEMAHFPSFHHLIINDDLDRAFEELRSIYIAGRSRTQHRAEEVRRRFGLVASLNEI